MRVFIFLLSFILVGCQNNINEEIVEASLESYSSNIELYNLYLKNDSYTLNKYEQEENVYLGIYLKDATGDFIIDFESTTNTSHSIYLYNLKLDESFPLSFVLNCYSKNKVPFITILPPDDITKTYDKTILKNLAKEFGNLNIPIFVNFYPLDQNLAQTPTAYKQFFKEAKIYFDMYASNVSFVWTIDESYVYDYSTYYPGDEYADWVGINIFENIEDEDLNIIFDTLDIFYNTFQNIKPIAISNLGISHFSNSSYKYNINTKIDELERFYSYIPSKYPQIKMINYINDSAYRNNENLSIYQNYSLTDSKNVLKAYQDLISNKIFKTYVSLNTENKAYAQKIKMPFLVYKKDDSFFIDESAVIKLGYEDYLNTLSTSLIDNKTLYNLNELTSLLDINITIDTENKNIILD